MQYMISNNSGTPPIRGPGVRMSRRTTPPSSRRARPCKGRWLAQDVRGPDAGYAVSLWDSLEDMQAYEQSALCKQEMRARLQPFFVGEFTITSCEVRLSQDFT